MDFMVVETTDPFHPFAASAVIRRCYFFILFGYATLFIQTFFFTLRSFLQDTTRSSVEKKFKSTKFVIGKQYYVFPVRNFSQKWTNF